MSDEKLSHFLALTHMDAFSYTFYNSCNGIGDSSPMNPRIKYKNGNHFNI